MAIVGVVPIAIAIGELWPFLAAAATAIATSAVIQGYGLSLSDALGQAKIATGSERIFRLTEAAQALIAAVNTTMGRTAVAQAGYNPDMIIGAVQASIPTAPTEVAPPAGAIAPPIPVPSFSTRDQLIGWWQGLVSSGQLAALSAEQYYAQAEAYNKALGLLAAQEAAAAALAPTAAAPTIDLSGLMTALTSGLGALTTQLGLTLSQGLAALAPPIVNVYPQPVVQPAPQVVVQTPPTPAPTVETTVDTSGMAQLLLPTLATLGTSLTTALTAGAENLGHGMQLGQSRSFGTTASRLLANTLPAILSIFAIASLQDQAGLGKFVDERFSALIDSVLGTTTLGVSPEAQEVRARATGRLKQAVSYGLQAHLWAIGAESNFITKNLGLGQVAGFLADLAGFSRLAYATLGTVEQASLVAPMRYLAQREFRPMIPGVPELGEMYAKKEIGLTARDGHPGLTEALALQGLPQEWIDVYAEHLWRDPRLGEIIRIGQFFSPALVPGLRTAPSDIAAWMRRAGIPDNVIGSPEWYYWWRAAKGGYAPGDVQIIAETAKRATCRREQTLYLDAVTRLARDGFISLDQAKQDILHAWAMDDPITARLDAIAKQRQARDLSDARSVAVLGMAKGLVTRDEARGLLTGMGMDATRAELEVLKGVLGMIPGMRLVISRPEEVLEEAGLEAE